MAKFKVGDRVRAVDETAILVKGREYTVVAPSAIGPAHHVFVNTGSSGVLNYTEDFFELVEPVAVAPATATFKVGDRVVFVTDNPNGGAEFGRAGDKVTVTAGPSESDSYGAQVGVTSPCGGAFEPLVPVTALRLDEPAAVASATAAPCAFEFVPFPQVGDAVLIPGFIIAINQSPRGTNYNIVFETQNRRMSLHFIEEDFILDECGDDGDCPCANNDNGPVPSTDTAKAFDALGDWLRSRAVSRAA